MKSKPKKIKIEKNVPLPTTYQTFDGWDDVMLMEVGDSFLTPYTKKEDALSAHQMCNRIRQRTPDKEWTCRAVPEGFRIWRTK